MKRIISAGKTRAVMYLSFFFVILWLLFGGVTPSFWCLVFDEGADWRNG